MKNMTSKSAIMNEGGKRPSQGIRMYDQDAKRL